MVTLVGGLDEIREDALREVANIGTGHAVTALAALTNDAFTMSVPEVGVHTLASFPPCLGNLESVVAVIYMPVQGDTPGHAAFIFPHRSACDLADCLLRRPDGETSQLLEIECSALMEAGNILISAFLSAIGDLTDLTLLASPPGIAIDMAGAVFGSILSVTDTTGDQVISIVTRLADRDQPVDGMFLYIPEPAALPTLFNALEKNR